MNPDQPTVKGLQHLRGVAAKALDDDAYRRRLLDDPAGTLKQEGLTVPDGVKVVVHQNTKKEVHLVLPTGLQDAQELSSSETDVSVLSRTGMHV
ncbi:MAG TPA: NHLP leader peptide family RiPP precursor [Solirubrobacteraceae bacterium]|jgi:Nitrile hydratase, alpha chain|nr:NHLP leader peptide family RiPP precursor [Solirubrobacteraceae bacterium]